MGLTEQQRDALVEEYSEQIGSLDTFALEGIFQSYVAGVEFYAERLGFVPQITEEDMARVHVLRCMLGSREDAEIRFH